jgi:hypothetical protein
MHLPTLCGIFNIFGENGSFVGRNIVSESWAKVDHVAKEHPAVLRG